jgi:hypothetical protein
MLRQNGKHRASSLEAAIPGRHLDGAAPAHPA